MRRSGNRRNAEEFSRTAESAREVMRVRLQPRTRVDGGTDYRGTVLLPKEFVQRENDFA
jgi:hypothetical protein